MALVRLKMWETLNHKIRFQNKYKMTLKRGMISTYFDSHPGVLMADNASIFSKVSLKDKTKERLKLSTLLRIRKKKYSNIRNYSRNYRYGRNIFTTLSDFKEE